MSVGELIDTGDAQKGAGNIEYRIRRFIVEPDSTYDFDKPDQAIDHPDLPEEGDSHPNAPYLKARRFTSKYQVDSANPIRVIVEVEYTVGGGTLTWQDIKYHWRMGTTSQKIDVDLDGKQIGHLYVKDYTNPSQNRPGQLYRWTLDEDRDIGTNILVPQLELVIEMPIPYILSPDKIASIRALVGTTNDADFPPSSFFPRPTFTIPRGRALLTGVDLMHLTLDNQYKATFIYRVAQVKAYNPATGEIQIFPQSILPWFSYGLRRGGPEPGSNQDDETILAIRFPIGLHQARIYEEKNHNVIF